jgi:hypothetical protein
MGGCGKLGSEIGPCGEFEPGILTRDPAGGAEAVTMVLSPTPAKILRKSGCAWLHCTL